MDQKSFNPQKIKKADSLLSGFYHAGGYLLMWLILRSGLVAWFFTPIWEILDPFEWTYAIPYHYFFLIALSVFPGVLGGYSLAKIRQAEDIRSFVTSYTLNFVFVFGLMTSPLILYHLATWQMFDLYYYPEIFTWLFNFGWGFIYGGLLVYFVLRRWDSKLPKNQAILLAALGFGFVGLFTNGFYALFGEFYYWVSVLRFIGLGFFTGLILGVVLKSEPENSIHGHFYNRSKFDF